MNVRHEEPHGDYVDPLDTGAEDAIRLSGNPNGGGVPLVLFPTLTLPGWITWKRLIEILGFQRPVLTFQLLSNRMAFMGCEPPVGYSLRWETRALGNALRNAGVVGPMDLVGHSAGGTLALDFALEDVERVSSLTLIEPSAPWVLREAGVFERFRDQVGERIEACAADMTEVDYAAFLQGTLNTPGYDPLNSTRWPLLWAYRGNVRFRPSLYSHCDDLERVRSAEFPVLLVTGRESDELHRATIEVLASAFRDSRTIELPGGHAPHYWEGLPTFVNALERFHRECGR